MDTGIGLCVCGNPDCYVRVLRRTARGVDVVGECGIEDTIISSAFIESARDRFMREFFENETGEN